MIMLAKSHIAINNLRSGIARIGKMSDNVVGVGPIGIGIGGVLAWIPVVGPLYSFGAGGLLLLAGLRARVPLSVMIPSFVLLSLRTTGEAVSDLFPVLNIPADVAIDLFRAHKWTADMMIKAIDETHYVEGRRHPSNPAYVETRARIRSGAEKRRVVFLG
jgi:hypothetical protein